jgi:RNA polymerase sigma factor (sigma-70 family)
MDDAELLQRYAAERSEAAFAEIVRRHVDLVYSAALRQMRGDHHRAQEVTQMVFVSLARKAAALVRHPVLPAWLYRSTGLAALDLQRREARRKVHERESMIEAALTSDSGVRVEWDRIRPVLDDAMKQLAERDRQAIVLRYFSNRPYAEVGRRLGLSENAARMRVDRALDKLRERLGRRGITSTCAALAAGLATEAAVAAPAGVAAAVASAAGAIGATAGSGLLLLMSANKIASGAVALFVAAGAATVAVQERANARLAAEVSSLQEQTSDFGVLQKENQSLVRAAQDAQSLAEANKAGDLLAEKIKALTAEAAGLRQQFMAEASRRRTAAAVNGQDQGRTFDISKLTQIPTPIFQGHPSYPFEMRQNGIGGQVVVDFVIDTTGAVRNAHVANSTRPEFEQAALDAVNQWIFSPGRVSGNSVNTQLEVPIVFAINNEPAAAPSTTPGSQAPTVTTVKLTAVPVPASPPAPTDWFPAAKN